MRRFSLALLALTACDSVEVATDACLAEDAVVVYLDEDGDGYGLYGQADPVCVIPAGYAELGGDCDDTADGIHPLADELCDGIDNNCNGLVDDDAVDAIAHFQDADEDGFGNPDRAWYACEAPDGYVSSDADCNDILDSVNPSAPELCDGIDNNCDGDLAADELDADEDGVMVCAGDCDDERGDINPSVPEQCDGTDTNCNGATDELGALGSTTWHWDGDDDGFGGAPSMQACDAPEGWVDNADDCDDSLWYLNTDCGTPSCEVCPVGVECETGDTCESGSCDGTCQEPACDDGVKNGDETDVDCGGSCTGCDMMQTCSDDADCLSATCIDNVCSCPNDLFCDDGNDCTDNVCNPDSHQCVTLNNNDFCDDGTSCTGGDQCLEGSCQATPVTCLDSNACTLDSCNDETGLCEFEPDPDFIEGVEMPGINLYNGCNMLNGVGNIGYDGTAVYRVFMWPGVPGQGAPGGWVTVNNCTNRNIYDTNAQFYWPSLLRKVCPDD